MILKLILKVRKDTLKIETDTFAYVFTMAKNDWITKSKRDKKVQYSSEILNFDKGCSEDDKLEKKEQSRLMDEMLSSLGEMCKDLLKLTFYLDHSLAEAAEKLGISNAGVAKTYQYRCKKKLFEAVRNNEAFKEMMQL